MGKPRNASLVRALRDQAVDNLYNSPKPYNYQGWNPHGLDKEAQKNDGVNLR
jgi:hypothetical protein